MHLLVARNFSEIGKSIFLELWEILSHHDLLGSVLLKLSTAMLTTCGLSKVHHLENSDDDQLSNKTTPTTAGSSVIPLLGKSIEKHWQSLVDFAKIDD
jgi:hypothetical protein